MSQNEFNVKNTLQVMPDTSEEMSDYHSDEDYPGMPYDWWLDLKDPIQPFLERCVASRLVQRAVRRHLWRRWSHIYCSARRIHRAMRLFLRKKIECPVCCEALFGAPYIRVQCGHALHKACLFRWGDQLIDRESRATCPLCRDPFRCLRFEPEQTRRLFIGDHGCQSYKRQRGVVEIILD